MSNSRNSTSWESEGRGDSIGGAVGRLKTDVYALATDEGRRVGTVGHAEAQRYLLRRLADCDLVPYSGKTFSLPYDAGRAGTMTNLVGLLPGADPELPPVLLGAHYDTCGAMPGADDNAAAVAALLAAGEPLRALGLRRSVVIALFDGEEPPHFLTDSMGSYRFCAEQCASPVAAAIVLDLVGHQVPIVGLEDLLMVLGSESSCDVATAVQGAAVPAGIRVLPVRHQVAPDMSDHAAFRRAGRPFLFLSCGHGPDYHQPTDTPDKIDYEKLAAVSGYVVELVRGLESGRLHRAVPFDTTSLELVGWERCWTPKDPAISSLPVPRSRQEIDRITSLLTAVGL